MRIKIFKLVIVYFVVLNACEISGSPLFVRIFGVQNPQPQVIEPIVPPKPSIFAEIILDRGQVEKDQESGEKLSTLLSCGANPNEVDAKGRTLLFYLVYAGQVKLAEILLKAGANPNHQDHSGNTVLHWLVRWWHVLDPDWLKMFDMLLANRAEPQIKNNMGQSFVDDFDHLINEEIKNNSLLVLAPKSGLHRLMWNRYVRLANLVKGRLIS